MSGRQAGGIPDIASFSIRYGETIFGNRGKRTLQTHPSGRTFRFVESDVGLIGDTSQRSLQ